MKITEIQKLNSKNVMVTDLLDLDFHPLKTILIERKACTQGCQKRRGERQVPKAKMVLGLRADSRVLELILKNRLLGVPIFRENFSSYVYFNSLAISEMHVSAAPLVSQVCLPHTCSKPI